MQRYPQAAPLVEWIEALEGNYVRALELASAIDSMRKTKIGKSLRDDYTLLSLCTVSYSMLLATANAYGHAQVAVLAERHLRRPERQYHPQNVASLLDRL